MEYMHGTTNMKSMCVQKFRIEPEWKFRMEVHSRVEDLWRTEFLTMGYNPCMHAGIP